MKTQNEMNSEHPVMTPLHSKWNQFAGELGAAVRSLGYTDGATRRALRRCGITNHSQIEYNLEFFRDHGGFDPLEIMLNVPDTFDANGDFAYFDDNERFSCLCEYLSALNGCSSR